MPYSVCFAGSADFGLPLLKALVADGRFVVEQIISQPARPVGRRQTVMLPPIGMFAEEAGLPLVTPKNKQELADFCAEMSRPDFLVVVAYGLIVPQSVLDWPKHVALNVHGSLLPKYRGASPIQSALLNGETKTGNSYMQMDAGLDTGPVFAVTEFSLLPKMLAADVFAELAEQAARDVPVLLDSIARGETTAIPQSGEASVCGKIKKADGEIRPSESTAEEILCQYRAYTPWPGIFWQPTPEQRVLVKEIDIRQSLSDDLPVVAPGEVALIDGLVYLGTTSTPLVLQTVQSAGKQAVSANQWIRGWL